ncbi:mitochondrial amidoxime-reducing component 1-like [Saccoglossus kowalevskii]|uniref:MOSC domain-containing protein 1, mitochondrial-like n=1 Tax=Saccoglossus kowalevskii TaxID=10224 RepID=A0ABM0GRL1_SACKO|nr:PREDICTED: MOSC domain-containing protein 1, mitochondrial-like [Saccoglossus kowalevskii]
MLLEMSSLSSKQLIVGGLAVAAVGGSILWYRSRRKARHGEMVAVGKVSAMFLHPVKSCRGIELSSGRCTKMGLRSGPLKDRHWMVVNADNVFITARQEPRMVLIKTALSDDEKYLQLDAPGMPTLKIPINMNEIPKNEQEVITTRVHRTECKGRYCGEVAEVWLSSFLDKPNFKLIYLENLSPRLFAEDPLLGTLGEEGDIIPYMDSTPYMVISQSSLDDLNGKLETSVTAKHFRPNFVLSGMEPFEEDKFKYLKLGNATLRFVKFCQRCKITKVDPETGIMHNSEPLETLQSYRKCDEDCPEKYVYKEQPLFGINMAIDVQGTVCVGDTVYASYK